MLLTDRALRARMGARARERALADFGIERMVERTLAVYDETPAAGRGDSSR
jgi:glycosyltransferase involved in cell wall biosynthesis